MTQEDKKLLLKDLCARLPYRVKIKTINNDYNYTTKTLLSLNPKKGFAKIGIEFDEIFDVVKIKFEEIRPYLFPLSSMTEEQEVEYNSYFEKIPYYDYNMHLPSYFLELLIDFYNKNHLDWRGLIPMGLAIDATGLNIY